MYYLNHLVTPPIDRAKVSADATRNISRGVAMAYHPRREACRAPDHGPAPEAGTLPG